MPQWLIDAESVCLVSAANASEPYVALSYVWGTTQSCQSCRDNLEELQTPGSLRHSSVQRSIRDVIEVLPRLGERYLWVDRLCIIQYDVAAKRIQIHNMAAIYANALTSRGPPSPPLLGLGNGWWVVAHADARSSIAPFPLERWALERLLQPHAEPCSQSILQHDGSTEAHPQYAGNAAHAGPLQS